MQQRLALARTLYVKPKYLLMDEPLSALDDKTRSKMQRLILDVHAETGNTIIMVTHSQDEAFKMCDTGAWHKEPFYKTEDRLPLGHGEKSVIILQSFIKLTRDEIVAIRWHMGSFDCAVKGGDYGMGNAFETYPLAVMTHLADMEATYLVEGLVAK